MIGAIKGYKVKLCMPACASLERRRIIEAFGAEIILTPAEEGTDGAIRKVNSLINDEPKKYFMPNQFENINNVLAHYETTGPEIYAQINRKIDVFVAGIGTGGTLMGTTKYLKERKPNIKIIGVEPREGHKIQGLKNMTESMIPKIYNPNVLDNKFVVDDDSAFNMTRHLQCVRVFSPGCLAVQHSLGQYTSH